MTTTATTTTTLPGPGPSRPTNFSSSAGGSGHRPISAPSTRSCFNSLIASPVSVYKRIRLLPLPSSPHLPSAPARCQRTATSSKADRRRRRAAVPSLGRRAWFLISRVMSTAASASSTPGSGSSIVWGDDHPVSNDDDEDDHRQLAPPTKLHRLRHHKANLFCPTSDDPSSVTPLSSSSSPRPTAARVPVAAARLFRDAASRGGRLPSATGGQGPDRIGAAAGPVVGARRRPGGCWRACFAEQNLVRTLESVAAEIRGLRNEIEHHGTVESSWRMVVALLRNRDGAGNSYDVCDISERAPRDACGGGSGVQGESTFRFILFSVTHTSAFEVNQSVLNKTDRLMPRKDITRSKKVMAIENITELPLNSLGVSLHTSIMMNAGVVHDKHLIRSHRREDNIQDEVDKDVGIRRTSPISFPEAPPIAALMPAEQTRVCLTFAWSFGLRSHTDGRSTRRRSSSSHHRWPGVLTNNGFTAPLLLMGSQDGFDCLCADAEQFCNLLLAGGSGSSG
ncbi:hypothetical protein DFJ73DRAFT_865311 [Zopfochytrium polystomum]|nr:hypothetical protein DFJ73DRAFT_865311 [Zopfochytrium polystomum]